MTTGVGIPAVSARFSEAVLNSDTRRTSSLRRPAHPHRSCHHEAVIAGIRDVALRAGVSIGTVSNVLANSPKVNPELRARVEQAIRELQYHPNHAALRQGYTITVQIRMTARFGRRINIVCLDRVPARPALRAAARARRAGYRRQCRMAFNQHRSAVRQPGQKYPDRTGHE